MSWLRGLCGLLFLTGLAAAPPPRVQAGVFAFRSFGVEEGLANLSVNTILQSPDGFIWVGTEEGVFRYDGRGFKAFNEGLDATDVWDLAAAGPTLWANATTGVFRRENGAFRPVPGSPKGHVHFLHASPRGELCVMFDNRIYQARGDGPLVPVKELPEKLLAGWASPGQELILGATLHHLWKGEAGTWTSMDLPAPATEDPGTLFRDRQGRIWYRGHFNLWRADGWKGPWRDFSRALPAQANNIFPPTEDGLGRIWIGTPRGLLCVDGDEPWVLGEAKGLPSGWAGPVLVDREGSLWAGSEGVHRLKGRFLWTGFGTGQGLPAGTVWDVVRGEDGQVYACTEKGLATLAGETWTVVPGTERHMFVSHGTDGRGGLWFGGTNMGGACNTVLRVDLKTRRREMIPVPSCLAANHVLAIAADGEGGVYLATVSYGLFHVEKAGAGWRSGPVVLPGPGGPERVNSLLREASGRLWMAGAKGVALLDQGHWRRLGAADGLRDPNCGPLAQDAQGNVWVAYQDIHGLSRLSREGASAVAYLDQPAALFQDLVSSMAFAPGGVLWLGTSRGMKRWDGTRMDVFGRGEGLPSQDPYANAIWADADGGIWQGFSNGLGHFDPRAYRGAPAPPAAKLLEARDARGPLPLEGAARAIRHRDGTLTFQFSALTFLNEAQVLHEVRLVGLENEWRETRINEARYPALPGGTYTFEVRSRYPEGLAGPVAAFPFRVLAPWWATWWFRALAAVAAGFLATLGFKARTAHLSRRNALLEAKVIQRTEEIQLRNSELAEALASVKQLSGLIPICSYCRKVRNDEGYYQQVEAFVSAHSQARFSHGICPDCQPKVKADLEAELKGIRSLP